LLLWATCHAIDAKQRWKPSTEHEGAKRASLQHPKTPNPGKSKADMLLGQCSLCQGPAATATYRKTDPAKEIFWNMFFEIFCMLRGKKKCGRWEEKLLAVGHTLI
jgi:hypothetical protein